MISAMQDLVMSFWKLGSVQTGLSGLSQSTLNDSQCIPCSHWTLQLPMLHGLNDLLKHLKLVTTESQLHRSAAGVLTRVVFSQAWGLQRKKPSVVLGKSLSTSKEMRQGRISLSWLPLEQMAHHCLLLSFSRVRHTN